eukprot:3112952-Rhodomonas_salina.1
MYTGQKRKRGTAKRIRMWRGMKGAGGDARSLGLTRREEGGKNKHLHSLLVELGDLAVGAGGQHGGDVAREVEVLQRAQGVNEAQDDECAQGHEDDHVRRRARRHDRL